MRRKPEPVKTCDDAALLFDAGLREQRNPPPLDADMQRVLDAWPTLPAAIRAGILAMIGAAGK